MSVPGQALATPRPPNPPTVPSGCTERVRDIERRATRPSPDATPIPTRHRAPAFGATRLRVILDRATSAVDNEAEAVSSVAGRLPAETHNDRERHRLSATRHADRMHVLDQGGGVAGHGTRDELLAKGGAYADSPKPPRDGDAYSKDIKEFIANVMTRYNDPKSGFMAAFEKAIAGVKPRPEAVPDEVWKDRKGAGIEDLCDFFEEWYEWGETQGVHEGLDYIEKFSWISYGKNTPGMDFVSGGAGATRRPTSRGSADGRPEVGGPRPAVDRGARAEEDGRSSGTKLVHLQQVLQQGTGARRPADRRPARPRRGGRPDRLCHRHDRGTGMQREWPGAVASAWWACWCGRLFAVLVRRIGESGTLRGVCRTGSRCVAEVVPVVAPRC
ncbi:hypothetical protein [Streptomyces sp. SID3343]|uniref:hypothetical protein n=1 Tax=Streptomyces sp. SID3343 TaxID=2690260 RepID=UPI001F2238FD|nr:hypothetical protein [Streptomyces sp. SID3343]